MFNFQALLTSCAAWIIMEHLCWNCGSPSHHRRECREPSNPDIRREIQKAYRVGTGSEKFEDRNYLQLQKMMEKQTMSQQKNLPPVHLYSLEVNRIHQLLYDMEVQGEIFEKPFTTISADCLAAKLLTVSSLRENLLQEQDNVRLISALMIPYHLNITDEKSTDYILVSTIETVQEMQKKLSNVLFNVSSNLKAAIKVINEITDAEKEVNDYYDRGLVVFSGRPLQVPIFLQSWNEKKQSLEKPRN